MNGVRDTAVWAGKADITPAFAVPLFGRSGRQEPVQRVKSRLEANCLYFPGDVSQGAAAIVTLDTLYPSQALQVAMVKQCALNGVNIAPERLLLVASHTHNAPALDDTKPNLGALSHEYLAFAASQIATCLSELAHQHEASVLRPITHLSYGQAACNGAVFRRRRVTGFDFRRFHVARRYIMAPNPAVQIDRKLRVLLFKDDDQGLRAVLWSWPCHAVSEPDAGQISSDFPGAIRALFREMVKDPNLPVLYFPGFSGDVRPCATSRLPFYKFGSWLGIGPRFAKYGSTDLQKFHSELAKGLSDAAQNAQDCGDDGLRLRCTRRTLAVSEIRTDGSFLAPLTCDDWNLGSVRIRAVSAEVASAYANQWTNSTEITFPTGCAGQVFGYLPTDSQLSEGGYEAGDFAKSFSVPGSFQKEVQAKVAQLIGN